MIEGVVNMFAEIGLFQLFFPWLMVLAIAFGLLEKEKPFGENSGVNGAVALSLAFLVTGGAHFFLPEDIFVVFAGALAFSIFGLLGLIILLGVVGFDIKQDLPDGRLPGAAATILAFSVFFTALFYERDWAEETIYLVEDNFWVFMGDVIMPVLIIGLLLGVVGLTLRD